MMGMRHRDRERVRGRQVSLLISEHTRETVAIPLHERARAQAPVVMR